MSSSEEKWKISLLSAVIFFLVASPMLFRIVNAITSSIGFVLANDGCPTYLGLFVHAIVFMLIVRLTMDYQIL